MTQPKLLVAALVGLCAACSNECGLDEDVRFFAGETARDCGSVAPEGDRAGVDACVAEAFDAGAPFIARYEQGGVDSKLVLAVASNTEGVVKLFQWDSSPCGGAGCDPVTDVQSCEGPALRQDTQTSEDPRGLPITCDRVGLAQRVCG
jgi:hypothetical protein